MASPSSRHRGIDVTAPEVIWPPVLVRNTSSPFYTPKYGAYVRTLSPKTDYRTFEGVGHFLMLEQPALFNKALLEMPREFDLLAK